METYYAIKEHLLAYGFLIEKKEMSNYFLTEKGRQLKAFGSLESFEAKTKKRSLIHKLFLKNTLQQAPDLSATY
jgi:predicted transcriptional regulator